MSEKYKFNDPDGLYFITLTIVKWVNVFSDMGNIDIIVKSLQFCQMKKGLIIHCWCIMPNHLHLIISRSDQKFSLSEILRDFKKFTSKEIVVALQSGNSHPSYLNIFRNEATKIKRNRYYKVWKDGNHPIGLDTNFLMDQKVDYIHDNPVKAGLCATPEEYEWSSARDYYLSHKGLLELEFIS